MAENKFPSGTAAARMIRLSWGERLARIFFPSHYRHREALYGEIDNLTARLDNSWLLHEQSLEQLTRENAALAQTVRDERQQIMSLHEVLATRVTDTAAALTAGADRVSALELELSRFSQAAMPRLEGLSGGFDDLQAARLAGERQSAEISASIGRLQAEIPPFQLKVDAHIGRLESALEQSREQVDAVALQLQTLRGVLDHYEHPVGSWFDYTAFEDKFRGPEAEIMQRQKEYLPLLRPQGNVVDLGCGRGELLQVLKTAGIGATGVDLNPDQVRRCLDKGLQVTQADIRSWLPSQPDGAFGAITVLQVVEHLHIGEMHSLIRTAFSKLKPGGMLLLETVNPHNPIALEWFYIDPTHRRPVFPEMLDFLLRGVGFKDTTVRFQIASPAGEPANEKTGMDFAVWGYKPGASRKQG